MVLTVILLWMSMFSIKVIVFKTSMTPLKKGVFDEKLTIAKVIPVFQKK